MHGGVKLEDFYNLNINYIKVSKNRGRSQKYGKTTLATCKPYVLLEKSFC